VSDAVEVVTCEVRGNTLKKAMDDAGLSQELTARRTGVMTSRQLNRLIHGEHCPSLERAVALSIVLGVPTDQLFRVVVRTRKAK